MDDSAESYMTRAADAAAVTRVELAMIRALEGFDRWAFFLHKSVCRAGLSAHDVRILHSIRMRGGAQNLSELLLFLNRNDVSTLQYSLKKIEQFGLIVRVTGNSKREAGYQLTAEGVAATDAYSDLREELLVGLAADVRGLTESLHVAAGALERLTGLYDQATQTILNRKILER